MNRRRGFGFHGGIEPNSYKSETTRLPIRVAPISEELVVPLHQNIGGTPRPLVRVGEYVFKGQRIGAADGNISAAVHAPTSGHVTALELRQVPHASGLADPVVVIRADGEDAWMAPEPFDWRAAPPDAVRDYLRDAGVVGLGGAVFPSHLKMRPGDADAIDTLILNGAECEPFITCDDLLMRERAATILRGASILARLTGARETLVGIEDNKPEAIAAMRQAGAGMAGVEVVVLPTRYPTGGAKQLIRALTGIEVPHGARSTEFGVQCFNVGTAHAVADALERGRPLISRIVTVAGAVRTPRNYEVLIGTPVRELLADAGMMAGVERVLMGGPMMGFALPGYAVPVVKATNCLIAWTPGLLPEQPEERPCIRCGSCAEVCPADLQPLELYWYARGNQFGKAQEYGVFDCIECGCCAYVCPSNIRLVDYYRYAKSEIWASERDKARADAARARFDARNARIEREKSERAARVAAKTAASRAAVSAIPDASADGVSEPSVSNAGPASGSEAAKHALIAQALARVRARQAGQDVADDPGGAAGAHQPGDTGHTTS